MDGLSIRVARPDDMARLDSGLRALSAELGHDHRAGPDGLNAAGFGAHPAFVALLAESGSDLAGVAMFSAQFSTVRGGAGAYVSDLWVAEPWRGQGVGERLLAAVRDKAAVLWDARFLRLAVALDNAGAQAFYQRLGFTPLSGETWMTLAGDALAALKGQR